MLVDFEVENFRSYREAKRLSLVASSAKELSQNLIDTEVDLQLVRSAVLYGPNASGKSNLLLAMDWMGILLGFPGSEEQKVWSVLLPFALDPEAAKRPSRFRVRFLIKKTLYDYEISARPWIIEEERLIAYPQGRPQEWFHRKGNEIDFNKTYIRGQKRSIKSMTPERTPLLTIANVFGHAQLGPPARWLASNLRDRLESLGPRSPVGPTETGRAGSLHFAAIKTRYSIIG